MNLTDAQYTECFNVFLSKLSPSRETRYEEYFSKKHTQLGLDKVRTFISVGPGDGVLEATSILPYFPACEKYIGIERRGSVIEILRSNIKKLVPDVQLITDVVERWEGPEIQVDFILASHILYGYIKDIKHEIKRMMDWLRPGGLLIIVEMDRRPWQEGFSVSAVLSAEIKEFISELGLNVIDEQCFLHDFDLTGKPKKLADFLRYRICTESEAQAVFELMERNGPVATYSDTYIAVQKS